MKNYKKHIVMSNSDAINILNLFNKLGKDVIIFIIDSKKKLIGSLTDGDIRRGLIKGLSLNQNIKKFMQSNPKYIYENDFSINDIVNFRNKGFKLIPVLNKEKKIIDIINFRIDSSFLPVDSVIMAGGLGSRLKKLTKTTPKPLLKVGDKPIIQHTIDRLYKFGIKNNHLCIRYLGDKIKSFFNNGYQKDINFNYIIEDVPMGTMGAITKIKNFKHEYILVSNSDILTTMNYEKFFLDFIDNNADMSVVTIPYSVNIPYGVLESTNNHIISLDEKPTYTYYSNGGIYLLKKEILSLIPENQFYNSTDLMEKLISMKKKLISYPLKEYWLDIGSPEDYIKAKKDFKNLDL